MNDCNQYWQHADYLPIDAVISYWCELSGFNTTHCRDAKKAAICSAVAQKQIKFRRSDGKTFEDDAFILASLGVLQIEKDSFNVWAARFSDAPVIEKPLIDRERETLLNIIGALLELIKSPKNNRDSNAAVIKEMLANYSDKPGIKERTLQEKFAAATRSLQSL